VDNWLGSGGSYGADLLWQGFGYGSLLLAVVLAAWGWLVATDRGLDFLPWRIAATFVAMLAGAIGIAAVDFHTATDTPDFGGSLGSLLSGGLISLLPDVWGRYLLAAVMLA